MGHLTTKKAYIGLAERLNQFPLGAPPTKMLFKILQVLFTEEEAKFISLMPIKPFNAKQASQLSSLSESECEAKLEKMADKGLLLDIKIGRIALYVLPPPMAGFFEFSMMRVRKDIDQKLLSELFYQYLSKEDDFMRELIGGGETQLGRIYPNEKALENSASLKVLSYDRSSEIVDKSRFIGVGLCYCRHKKSHLNMACDTPQEVCLTFGATARSLIRHGNAKKIGKKEAKDILQMANDYNLVQFGENAQQDVAFICNCCGCCCEALTAVRRFSALIPITPTRFLPQILKEKCNGCTKCSKACPVEAMTMVSAHNPENKKQMRARLNQEICLGCGVCVNNCNQGALSLIPSPKRVITPYNSAHRYVLMAIERGKLQNLIFDKQALLNHRVMATILGVLLKLPPIKQTLASKQVQSRYIERLFNRKPK